MLGKFALPRTASGWVFLILLGFLTAAACFLYQEAARYAGAPNTAMLSTFEPLTSVIVGALVYQEKFTLRSTAGIICILLSVVLLGLEEKRAEEAACAEKASDEADTAEGGETADTACAGKAGTAKQETEKK